MSCFLLLRPPRGEERTWRRPLHASFLRSSFVLFLLLNMRRVHEEPANCIQWEKGT